MQTVQDIIDARPDLVKYFKEETGGSQLVTLISMLAPFIPPEFTNWREEQRAWRETAVLFDQSHHMSVTYLKGSDAKRMLSYLSPSTFANLAEGRGKQYFVSSPYGHHIGDCILHYYGEKEGFELISGNPLQSWVNYHAQTGDFDVEATRDLASPLNPSGPRRKYRFQLEGPKARTILQEVCEGGWPELKFFHTTYVKIAGCQVHVLRHGMAGHAGAEISGPWDEMDTVRTAILKAGEKHGLRQGGTVTYYTTPLENGWIPTPFPAIFTGDEMEDFRKWLPARSFEGQMQVSGSYYSDNIEDYYWDAWSLGYDKFIKFDHDFIGRPAMEAMLGRPHRVKRSLEWNSEDVTRVLQSQLIDGPTYKAINFPNAFYGTPQADEVLSMDGRHIGVSQWCGYSANEKRVLSLCGIDAEFADLGTEVILIWGEKDGGSGRPSVERHEQTRIRAKVAPAPFPEVSRQKIRAII
ncbi:aminomethyl transferase family protein [Brucella anthropi]|uniref:aminomethyl transferase family protein n=1 Tax=Brucella anthropi TaxID=529 RepID=UPI001F28430C|nr:aminomethyl transferase family protein [Brucella anthropi]